MGEKSIFFLLLLPIDCIVVHTLSLPTRTPHSPGCAEIPQYACMCMPLCGVESEGLYVGVDRERERESE